MPPQLPVPAGTFKDGGKGGAAHGVPEPDDARATGIDRGLVGVEAIGRRARDTTGEGVPWPGRLCRDMRQQQRMLELRRLGASLLIVDAALGVGADDSR